MFRSLFKSNQVEFFCAKEDFGVIPEPYPARKLMPDWYRNLPGKVDNKDVLKNSTIKRCLPFLDAMTTGWIIPLAADVVFETNADASGVSYHWEFYKPMVENHGANQITGHRELPKPPMKFMNYIFIRIPAGHSALFVPPLNRGDARFECISGMVDSTYMGEGNLELINFPFFFKEPNYTGIIKAGTPLVQMIVLPHSPITFQKKANWRQETKQDSDLIGLTRRRRASHESLYRDTLWKNK